MQYDVLMVDDEEALASSTSEYLSALGLQATYVTTAEAANEFLAEHRASVILLDINLPGMNGFEFCRRVRAVAETPILFVSAREADDDQILALSLGGDDYIRKPYSLSVLHARIRRVLARLAATPAEVFDDGHLRFDPAADRFWVDSQDLVMPAMEHRLLRYLVEHRGRVVPKHELFDHVWGDAITGDGTLSVHVRRLRTRIEPDPDNPHYLRTVWGRGYLFEDVGS